MEIRWQIRRSMQVVVMLLLAKAVSAQLSTQEYSIIANIGVNLTQSLSYAELYAPFPDSDEVILYETSSASSRNYNLAFVLPFTTRLHFKGSIGKTSYGFRYNGRVNLSPFNGGSSTQLEIWERYNVSFLEVSTIMEYRIKVHDEIQLYFGSGFGWLTNPKKNFDQILTIFMKNNNFSLIGEGGIEVPLLYNSLHARLGLQARLPLGGYADSFGSQTFNPYAVGILTGLKFIF